MQASQLPRVPARKVALWGVGLLVLALWMAIRPCRGIVHDGMIYTLFAMARLYPSLQHDFFVLYGTQDHYTLFSPLYAAAIEAFGLDRAADLIVFITQAVFFSAAWLLTRRITTSDNALLGLGLLVVLPSWYGANLVFSHTEMFPTPRQPAEAFALLGMSFAISSRRWTAAACMLLAVALHPIIAGAGVLFWVVLEFGLPNPRAAALTGAGLASLGVLVSILPHSPLPHFDPNWLYELKTRLNYLFPTLWSVSDWNWSVPGIATLLVGALGPPSANLQRLCRASLVTVLVGVALAIVGGDLLHLTFAAQLQMWRWLWLSGVLSNLLLPAVALNCWNAGISGRAATLALAACWLTNQPLIIFAAAALAGLSAITLARQEPPAPREQWVLLVPSGAILAIAAGLVVIDWYDVVLKLRTLPPAGSHIATLATQFRSLTGNAPLAAALLVSLWYLARSSAAGSFALLVLATASCIVMLPQTWPTWTRIEYPPAVAARFESWRRIIPEDAEVLWPDTPPAAVWYSLHRANYWSLLQMAGMVFSRQDWVIGDLREGHMEYVLPNLGGSAGRGEHYTVMTPEDTVRSVCTSKDIRFFASWRDLGPSPYPIQVTIRPQTGKAEPLHLYHCRHEPH